MFFGERKLVDEEGFQYRYVPKETIVIEKNPSGGSSRKGSRKYSNVSAGSSGKTKEKFVYVKKQPKQDQTAMQQLLGGLKAVDGHSFDDGDRRSDEEDSEDEDFRRIMSRKVSMNEQNVIGMNFEKYNREGKPSGEIRRKIGNFVLEYQDTQDKVHAKNSFLEMCQESGVSNFTFVGYILNNTFSLDQTGWDNFLNLIIDDFYTTEKVLTSEDLLEG